VSARRRRFSPLPLVGLSLALMLAPSALSHKVRLTALGVFTPLRRLAAAVSDVFPRPAPAGERDIALRENAFLRDRVETLASENARLRDRLAQAAGLQEIAPPPAFFLLPADVILPSDASSWRRSLTVALGSRGGARPGMIAVHHRRLVGRLSESGPWQSRIQLVTDPGFRARAVAAPHNGDPAAFESRRVGLYQGTSEGAGLLRWLAEDTPVEPGTVVLTTEDPSNGIPAGLILGRVRSVARGRGPSLAVEVEPVLNFRGLEQVMLLGRPPDP